MIDHENIFYGGNQRWPIPMTSIQFYFRRYSVFTHSRMSQSEYPRRYCGNLYFKFLTSNLISKACHHDRDKDIVSSKIIAATRPSIVAIYYRNSEFSSIG